MGIIIGDMEKWSHYITECVGLLVMVCCLALTAEDFGRSSTQMTATLDTPPYYAIRVKPAIHHTMGGIRVDADMHVLRTDDTPVPGLFAAGEVTGGVHGANRLGGNGVADIVVNGKIAGRGAAMRCQ